MSDGVQTLRLEADGDGTAGSGLQDATLRIDRTRPTASVALLGLPDGLVRATVSVSDAASGVREWRLRRAPDGPPVASSATGGNIVDIDLAQHAAPGESIRFVLTATDNAGLTREVTSALATRPGPGIAAPATTIIGDDGPLGVPGRIEASGAPLPNFSRIETRGLRAHGARGYSRAGRLRIPLIAATYARPVTVKGRFLHPNGKGLRGATVYLVDPKGFTAGTTLTDRRGQFAFRARPRTSGTWRAIALGRPLVVAPAVIQLRPRVHSRISSLTLRPGDTLRVTGSIAPRRAGRAKLVKLEWRLRGQWLPLRLTTADRRGRFALRHRFSPGTTSFTVSMRIVVPREKGWRFLPTVARRFAITVR